MVALVIPVYNRHSYVKLCFDSLLRLTTKPDILVIVDDASGPETKRLIAKYATVFIDNIDKILLLGNERNQGVKATLQRGIEKAIEKGATTIINLDSDAIVTPDFVERLLDVKESFPYSIVSGFNHVSKRNPAILQEGDTALKEFINGINMCFNVKQYNEIIKPALTSEGNWDFNVSHFAKHRHVFTVPSCVQHIGMESSMGHSGNGQVPDVAQDFPVEYMPENVNKPPIGEAFKELNKRFGHHFEDSPKRDCQKPIHLPNVTLFGIDAHDTHGISRAAEICERNIQFGAVNIITQRLFPGASLDEGRRNYSKFMIKELYKHFETSHVLTIHADGYVQNPEAWDDSWLEFDFIGATWGYKDGMNCGNGGFSLRSKKLCEILASDPHITEFHPEDCRIARHYRPYLEQQYGIKFAPEEVANKFSIEAYGSNVFIDSNRIYGNQYSGQFGFHGHHVKGLKIPMR